jgi:uncharacterized membrane protein
MLEGDEKELWEIDYQKKIALNISDLNFVKNNVSNYVGTIEDFLKEKVSLKSIFMKMVHFLLVPIIKVKETVHLDNFANYELRSFLLS